MSSTLTDEQYRNLSTERLERKLREIANDETQSVSVRCDASNALEMLKLNKLSADRIIHSLCYWNNQMPASTQEHAKDLTNARKCWKKMHGIDGA